MPAKKERDSERIKKLVNAAISPAATRSFLKKFYKYGHIRGFFPKKPSDLKAEELGKWMGQNKTISDNDFLREMMLWLRGYSLVKLAESCQPRGIGKGVPAKTLANFWRTGHGDCLAMSTAFGEMAAEMGFSVQYYIAEKSEVDLSKLTKDERKIIEQQKGGHSYVSINGVQYDPALKLIGTKHRGKEITKEQHAARIWTGHGNILRKLGRYKHAIKSHELAIEIDSKFAVAWNNKGVALSRLGGIEKELDKKKALYWEAIKCCDEAIGIDPKLAVAWNTEGNALSRLGGIEKGLDKKKALYWEAINCYDKAIGIDSKLAEAWYNKGNALLNLGDIEKELDKKKALYWEAINCYDEAIGIDSKLVEAWHNKGNALLNLGDIEKELDKKKALYWEAIEYVKKALSLTPEGHPNRKIMLESLKMLESK